MDFKVLKLNLLVFKVPKLILETFEVSELKIEVPKLLLGKFKVLNLNLRVFKVLGLDSKVPRTGSGGALELEDFLGACQSGASNSASWSDFGRPN